MISGYSEHPSRICGHVAFRVDFETPPNARTEDLVRDCLESAVGEYIGLYGDKTKVRDPVTDRPKVDHHYDLRRDGNGFAIDVHGSTGHMGAMFENDGAITKMATMVRALVLSKARLETFAGSPPILELAGRTNENQNQDDNKEFLKLEGGQGFVPTHGIEEVMDRIIRAAERGAETYLGRIGRRASGSAAVRGSFEKLHNAAYDGDSHSPAMQTAVAVARECGTMREDEPIVGWTVSCDARLFANEYPGMSVLTGGAGRLLHAHSDEEQMNLDELVQGVEFLALYILKQTGTI
jgi:acetylornithine deacetylase/succinyl-diaminopimelate desuccinylase-like protein